MNYPCGIMSMLCYFHFQQLLFHYYSVLYLLACFSCLFNFFLDCLLFIYLALRYNLEAEWRNKYPGSRTLDRDDLFELGKADMLSKVAGLQMREPAKWETLLMHTLWENVSPHILEIFMEAAQGHSAG